MSSPPVASFPDETDLSLHEREVGDPHHARGGVLLLHGLGEHSGRHQSILERFAEHGFYGRTFDWPGHGRSPGRRGHFVSLRQLTHIIDSQCAQLKEALEPGTPIGLLGHSMGGFWALYYLTRHPEVAQFAWIGSTLVHPAANASRLKRLSALLLSRFLPAFPLRSGIDPAQCRELSEEGEPDPLMHRKLTARTGTLLLRAAEAIRRGEHRISPALCLLMTHGSADTVCPPAYSKALFERLTVTEKRYVSLPGALHEPYHGESGLAFFSALDEWIEATLLPHLSETVSKTDSAI